MNSTSPFVLQRVRDAIFALTVGLAITNANGCARQGAIPAEKPAQAPAKAPVPAQAKAKAESAPAKPPKATKVYPLRGIVRGVNKEAKQVRIRHEEIPGFMGAMTMPFTIKDPHAFDDLQVGDKVEGKLRVDEENGQVVDYELSDLEVTEPYVGDPKGSPAQELVVDLAGGSPSLKVKPKTLGVGEVVPDFTMTSQDGKTFKLSDLKGNVVALTFVYTRCPLPDFCPAMDRKFSELAQKLALSPNRAARVRLISVSFDPEHDTPDVLKKHARIRGVEPPLWTYAVASHPELLKIAPKLGLVYGPGRDEIIHNLCTAIIDPQGKLARLEVGTTRNKWEPADFVKTIASLIPVPGE